jgi:hypothetical protein
MSERGMVPCEPQAPASEKLMGSLNLSEDSTKHEIPSWYSTDTPDSDLHSTIPSLSNIDRRAQPVQVRIQRMTQPLNHSAKSKSLPLTQLGK